MMSWMSIEYRRHTQSSMDYLLNMKVVQQSRISITVLTFLILFSSLLLDPGWSMPAVDPDENWVCDAAHIGRKKPLPGHCYSYQQCQWRELTDYDMEIVSCSGDKIYDESVNACVDEKAISFDFDKSRCEKRKPNMSSANHNSKTQQSGRSVTNGGKELPQAKHSAKPYTMEEMKKLSEQSSSQMESMKLLWHTKSKSSTGIIQSQGAATERNENSSQKKHDINEGSPALPETHSLLDKGVTLDAKQHTLNEGNKKDGPKAATMSKTPAKSAFSSSESMPTLKPILENNRNPFDTQPVRPKSEATFIQEPNFFKPFNNFPPTEKSSRRILFHEPFVKPYYFAAKNRVGVWPKWE